MKAAAAVLAWTALICTVSAVRGDNHAPAARAARSKTVRIGATQPRSRIIDYKLGPAEALAQVDRTLGELEQLVHKAAGLGCDVVVFPEDTLGTLHWEQVHKSDLPHTLPVAVKRMLDRLGKAAASHRMYLICGNNLVTEDRAYHNTAFFLDRKGREIGRYYKVNMPIHELDKQRGNEFPVFETPDLGGVGMLICYDMVFPEAARCLALGGADIVFNPTLGGAALGGDDINRAAFRTRAAENYIYLVVSARGGGSMIIDPQGKVIGEAQGSDEIAVADIDPFTGREGGDAMNFQKDMRARIFRERSPEAFKILTDPNPPVLKKVPEELSIKEATRIAARTLTSGNDRFREAEELAKSGRKSEAIAAFERLRSEFRGSWVDRESQKRLKALRESVKGSRN